MRSEYIYPILWLFPVLVLQTTIIPLIAINGIVPDLVIVLLVFYTLKHGQVYGTALGFVYGLIFDLITGSLLGSSMLAKTLAGFVAGYFSNENKIEIYFRSYNFALIVLLCSVINAVINAFFSTIDINSNLFTMIFQLGLMPGIYTAVIGLVSIVFYPRRKFT